MVIEGVEKSVNIAFEALLFGSSLPQLEDFPELSDLTQI